VGRHRALFYEPYPERPVNNLYFDTPDLHHYHDHINGLADRIKVRWRWYGDFSGQIDQPQLELKVKRGLVSAKATHALPPFAVNGNIPRDTLENALRRDSVPAATALRLHGLEPALANRYHRRYFLSADGAVRLTVDWGLEFMTPRLFLGWLKPHPHHGPLVIVELKYPPEQAARAAAVASAFPFRLTRCSKYVLGVHLTSLGGFVEP
jgi:hypothetical protein